MATGGQRGPPRVRGRRKDDQCPWISASLEAYEISNLFRQAGCNTDGDVVFQLPELLELGWIYHGKWGVVCGPFLA